MKLPKLKIPVKDVPLVALGVTVVLVSGLFGVPFVRFLLVGMFFGILSKEIRWVYWGMALSVDGFRAFRVLLTTDRETLMFDTIWRVGIRIGTVLSPILNSTDMGITNSSIESQVIISQAVLSQANELLMNIGNNPILTNPVIGMLISIILLIVGGVFWVLEVIALVVGILVMLPIFGYMVLMLRIFHWEELVIMFETAIATYTIPETLGRLMAPYLLQGLVIMGLLASAILPLLFYRILKRIGFYKRIPGIQS